MILFGLLLATFKAEFVKMLDMAGTIAEARARTLLDQYIERIERENRVSIESASDPDFRYCLYMAQRIAARCVTDDLPALLVEILVQRARQPPRSFIQLVLSESIEVLQKIPVSQVNTLTLIFAIKYLKFSSVSSFESLLATVDKYVSPILDNVASSHASLSHLEYAGCGTVSSAPTNFELDKILRRFYPGAFQAGVSEANVYVKGLSPAARGLLVQCEHDPRLVQVLGGSLENLRGVLDQMQLDGGDRHMLETIFCTSSQANVLSLCAQKRAYFAQLSQLWATDKFSGFSLTSVGFAIAHANLSMLGPVPPLSNWIH